MEPRTQWRGEPDTSRSRLWRLLALSALLHAPLTPLAALVGLVGLLVGSPPPDVPPPDPINAIPVDLISDPGPEPAPAPTGTAAEPKPEPPGDMDDPFKDLDNEDPSGMALVEPDAGAPPARPLAADGGADGGGAIGDPVAMSGTAGRLADANANVRLLIFNDRIRNHPLGKRIGTLLGLAAQWQDFLGPGKLDPIRDIDRILIAGPQLRDSSQVVVVLRVNVPGDRMKRAIDALVQRDKTGGWLDAGIPVAHAKADRADRVFVMPSPHIVVIAPPSAEKNAIAQGPTLRFPNPKGKEALTTYVVTPWRAFRGIPFKVPQSIRWVRMKVVATSDGGAEADLVAEDESPSSATQHAKELGDALNAVTQINLEKRGLLGRVGSFLTGKRELRLIEPVTFTAQGKEIHGTVIAKPKQLEALLEAISDYAKSLAEEAEKKQKAAAADAGVPDAAPAASADASAKARPAPKATPEAGPRPE